MNADESKYFAAPGRSIALVLILCLCGCVASRDARNQSTKSSLERESNSTFITGENLLFAIFIYRMDTGRWPQSPNDLRGNTDFRIEWDRFENLAFTLRNDGDFEITFDHWTGPKEMLSINKGRFVIGAVDD